tara:strand:- start:1150 stop:1812 length:663 start_codon:yes stop_codon:yes gene_type:complete
MKINLTNLQKKIGVKFKNINLLKKSLTHKSYDSNDNYEKLEFLGDRVLGLIISKKLIDLFPDETEGSLDKKFASMVNKNRCCEIGKKILLDKYILIRKSKNKRKVENKIISDCCEALIGAIYLDKGFYFVEKFILRIWDEHIKSAHITFIDSKTKLQELSLKIHKKLPTYKLVSNTGPKHKPNFKVAVKLNNTDFTEGNGSSIKKAQQNAAEILLKQISS